MMRKALWMIMLACNISNWMTFASQQTYWHMKHPGSEFEYAKRLQTCWWCMKVILSLVEDSLPFIHLFFFSLLLLKWKILSHFIAILNYSKWETKINLLRTHYIAHYTHCSLSLWTYHSPLLLCLFSLPLLLALITLKALFSFRSWF